MTTIQFAEKANQTIEFSTNITKDLWYSKEDFRRWKKQSREAARSWRLQGFGVLLEHVFEEPSAQALEQLTAMATLDEVHCFRGMERCLNDDHDMERSRMEQAAIFGLLEHQQKLKRQRSVADTGNGPGKKENTQENALLMMSKFGLGAL